MVKLLALLAVVVVIVVMVARLRARLPSSQSVAKATRRGLLRQPLDVGTQEQTINLLMQGRKLQAIRLVGRTTGLGYRDAKLLVEAIEAGHRPARVVQGEAHEI